ncbi:MAG: hypothetical protein EAZ12_01210 [Sphingobacteriia bacterium]|nr:MAG: hypothetical protein EAZ12_01210 [Sphingobacteriia bacterium]
MIIELFGGNSYLLLVDSSSRYFTVLFVVVLVVSFLLIVLHTNKSLHAKPQFKTFIYPPPEKIALKCKNSYFGVLKISCLLFLILAIIGCKKLDKPQEATSPENGLSIENKFFNLHRSANSEENALIAFLQRRNGKTHFVEETVKRIGYPHWDKMFKIKTGNTKDITIQSTSTSQTKNATSSGSYNTYYVPFVRDSQNHVNATMVINTTPTDTSLGYLCDWQYNNKPHSSPNVDTSAEKFAMFFMMMNNRTLGHKEFDITDPRLFSSLKGGAAIKRIGISNNKINSVIGKLDLPIFEECIEYYFCGSLDYCAQRGGCDYRNCYDNTSCWPAIICWQYFSSGGSSWSYSSGNNNGGSGAGGGTGGYGNSGDLPPIICDSEPSQASTPNKKVSSTIISNSLPCNPFVGWVPVTINLDRPRPRSKAEYKLPYQNRLPEDSTTDTQVANTCVLKTLEYISTFLGKKILVNDMLPWAATNLYPGKSFLEALQEVVSNGILSTDVPALINNFFDSISTLNTAEKVRQSIQDGYPMFTYIVINDPNTGLPITGHAVMITGWNSDINAPFEYFDPLLGRYVNTTLENFRQPITQIKQVK